MLGEGIWRRIVEASIGVQSGSSARHQRLGAAYMTEDLYVTLSVFGKWNTVSQLPLVFS